MIKRSRSPGQQKLFIILNFLAKFGVYKSHGNRDIAVFRFHVIPRDQKVIATSQQNLFVIMIHSAMFGVSWSYGNRNIAVFRCRVIPRDQMITTLLYIRTFA